MKLEITQMDYHRNGICGVGFYTVLFKDHTEKQDMIATVFPSCFEQGRDLSCAVYDLRKLSEGDIQFGSNSWRGDRYFYALKPLMEKWWHDHNGYAIGE
jgi:hypothetical protein